MKRHRFFQVTFLRPTNNNPARIKIQDLYWKETKIIPYKYSESMESVKDFLNTKGIAIVSEGMTFSGFILGTENFDINIK